MKLTLPIEQLAKALDGREIELYGNDRYGDHLGHLRALRVVRSKRLVKGLIKSEAGDWPTEYTIGETVVVNWPAMYGTPPKPASSSASARPTVNHPLPKKPTSSDYNPRCAKCGRPIMPAAKPATYKHRKVEPGTGRVLPPADHRAVRAKQEK